jgi:hypothetical protein
VAGTIVVLLLTRALGRGAGTLQLSMIALAVVSLLVADLGFAYKPPDRRLRHRGAGRRRLGGGLVGVDDGRRQTNRR